MQNKLSLKDVKWEAFKIEDIFNVEGSTTTQPNCLKHGGKTPRITCAASNNGLENTYHNKFTETGGVLTVDSATDGAVFYQFYDFIATDHVEKITNKLNKRINKEIGLFIKTSIEKAKCNKYRYGYKFSQARIKKQSILLPVDSDGNPHWQFMENYIKQERKIQAQKIIDYYEQKMLKNAFELLDFKNVEWKTFKFNEIFQKIERGKRLTKANQIKGHTPYISSTSLNNGIDNFIQNDTNVRKYKNTLSIANSGSVGSCFYHYYEYIASDHVTNLQSDNGDKYIYLFMSTVIRRLEEKYSFNREINDERIKNEKILLPADKNGNPYWEYMRKFMQRLETEKMNKFLPYIYIYIYIYIYRIVINLEKNIYNINTKRWYEFWLEDLCKIQSGTRLTKKDQVRGCIPFIGATDSNNGITEFISNINNSLDKNVLGVNYNGSVVYNFYHPYSCVFSDDVKRLHFKEKSIGNEYTYLFLKQTILQQRKKYAYGYKFNGDRMKRQKILLPISDKKTPDYEFIQKYILIQEIKAMYTIVKSLDKNL